MPSSVRFRRRLFFFAATILCFMVIWPIILPLGIGAVLGFLSEGILVRLMRRFRIRKRSGRYWLAAALVVASLLGIFLPLGLTVAAALRDVSHFLENGNFDTSFFGRDVWGRLASWVLGPLREHGIELSVAEMAARFREWGMAVGSRLGSGAAVVLAATPGAMFDSFIALAAWLVLAVEGREARRQLLPLFIPWDRERRVIAGTMAGVIRSIFVANALVSLVQAVIAGLVLGIAGFPRAAMLGFLAFFASFLPVFGTALVLVPCGAWYGFNGHPVAGIVIAASAALVGLVDNFLRPLFMRGGLDLGFFWILVAFVGGVAAFGLAGALLGPLAFSLFMAFWRMLSLSENENKAILVPPASGTAAGAPVSSEGETA